MELPSLTSDDATRLGFTLKRSSRSITLALVSPGFSDHSTLITRFSLSISVTLAEWIRPLRKEKNRQIKFLQIFVSLNPKNFAQSHWNQFWGHS